MNIEGLDKLDNEILDVLKENARATFSEIGKQVGLSRVAVKNRVEILEKNGVIQGYKTIVDKTKVPMGMQFVLDVETVPGQYQEVMDVLGTDNYIKQLYSVTGECRLHAMGFAPNMSTLESHLNRLFRKTKGIRKLSWHLLLTTIKDEDGGMKYVRYQETEYLESKQQV